MLAELWLQLGKVAPRYSLGALALYLCSLLLTGTRWRLVFSGLGKKVSLFETVMINWCSIFVSNVTPIKVAGEVTRVVLVRQRCGVDVALAGVAQGYDRITDLVPLFLMLLLSLTTVRSILADRLPGSGPWGWLVGLTVVLFIVVGLWVILRSRRSQLFFLAWRERFARFRIDRRTYALAGGLSVMLWLFDQARLILVAHAFGVTLSLTQAIALSVIALLGTLLPTIGGLGAVEGGLTAALLLYGVSLDKALAITLLERGISYGVGTAGGGITLLFFGGREVFRAIREQSQPPAPAAPAAEPASPSSPAPTPSPDEPRPE